MRTRRCEQPLRSAAATWISAAILLLQFAALRHPKSSQAKAERTPCCNWRPPLCWKPLLSPRFEDSALGRQRPLVGETPQFTMPFVRRIFAAVRCTKRLCISLILLMAEHYAGYRFTLFSLCSPKHRLTLHLLCKWWMRKPSNLLAPASSHSSFPLDLRGLC